MVSLPIQRLLGLMCVAGILTLLNAAKPAVVDDTAYLKFADQSAEHPFDPYGFELMWSAEPAPASKTLAPPVYLNWLALCKKVLGPSLFMLKLGLFPVQLLLCISVQSLTRTLLNRDDTLPWITIVGSSAVLPMWNCMIDMPAITLGLAGLALMLRPSQSRIDPWIAGLMIGLAMQTKYTTFTFPLVVILYGIIEKRYAHSIIVVAVSMMIFISWESLMVMTYGESHFLYHALHRPKLVGEESSLIAKLTIVKPMITYLGVFTLPCALLLARMTRRWSIFFAVLTVSVTVAICIIPSRMIVGEEIFTFNSAKYFYQSLGISTCILYGIVILRRQIPLDRCIYFLLGWLLIEVVGCIAMSPFPAARRFLMIAIVIMLLSYRIYGRPLPLWHTILVLALSLILHTVDCWDALAAKTMAHHAREHIPAHVSGRIWFQGTWGWRYYCEAEGMQPIVPGSTHFEQDDWLVLCVPPDGKGFHRPMALPIETVIGSTLVVLDTELVEDDLLQVSSIPALYGGVVPMESRHNPRFRVQIYRVIR